MQHLKRLLVVLCLLAVVPAYAQSETPLRIVTVDQSKFPTLAVTVSYQSPAASGAATPPFSVTVNGAPVDPANITVDQLRLPVAVALVADLSARMSDRGTAGRTRHADMEPLIKNLVSQLQGGEQRASLVVVTDKATLAHPLTNDLVAIQNTLINANPDLLFVPAPLEGAAPDTPYPLADGLSMALEQLAAAPEELPRALVVFAAGDPQQQLESPALRQALEQARADKRPISVLVFAFGSADAGSFDVFAANPTGLEQFATAGGGSFLGISGAPLDENGKRAVNDQFGAILDRGQHYLLEFTVDSLPSGPGSVQVAANGSDDTRQVEFSASLPPRFDVVTDSRDFQDRVRLSVNARFQQSPIVKVQYFLNNIQLPQEATKGPDFALDLDVYDTAFQQLFPPGDYELDAAAFDQDGRQSRSESQISITVFAPPANSGPSLPSFWWVLPLTLVVAVGAVLLVRRRGNAKASALPSSRLPAASQDDDELTSHFNPPPPAESDLTERFDDEKTQRVSNGHNMRVLIDLFEDGTWKPLQLTAGRRYYTLGRQTKSNQPDVAVPSPKVSREHAQIEVFVDSIELVDLGSENGTFFGEDRQRLTKNKSCVLRSGDVFWLSPEVKLRIRSEIEKHDK